MKVARSSVVSTSTTALVVCGSKVTVPDRPVRVTSSSPTVKVLNVRSAGPTNTVKLFTITTLSGEVKVTVTVLFPKSRSLSPSTSAIQPVRGVVGATVTISTEPGTVITSP